jgi:excisionase family DNA binding protein
MNIISNQGPQGGQAERLMLPREVAAAFRVEPKTVTRWANAGKLTAIRTVGGHRRYRESEVRLLIATAITLPCLLPGGGAR